MDTSACSNPTPTVRTPDRARVHSSIASSRSIRAAAGGADSSTGRPAAAAGRTRAATHHPVSAATTTPAASPASSNPRVRALIRVRRARAGWDRGGAGGRGGALRSPTTRPIQAGDDQGPGDGGKQQCGHDTARPSRRYPSRSNPYRVRSR